MRDRYPYYIARAVGSVHLNIAYLYISCSHEMKVKRFQPSAFLAPYVREFVVIESDTEMFNKTIPDTALVMAFRYDGCVVKIEGNNKETLSSATVAGVRKTVRHFYYAKGTANLLVILKEGGFASFSRIPAHELFTSNVSTENLFHASELAEILERLSSALTDRSRIQLIESFLRNKITHPQKDSLTYHAVEKIQQQRGIVRIKELASSLYISQDPFEKRFRTMVGCSPKQYASIIRLRNLIKNFSHSSSLTALSHDAGYFDQSHFIKDFKLFTGQLPKDFFKSPGYW